MYISFDNTTHYATKQTLVILSDRLIRSKEARYLSHTCCLTAVNVWLFLFLSLHPEAGVW